MAKSKTKAIQTNFGTFRHNQTYPGIIQAYSGIFRTLCYPTYLELWYIQNPEETRSIHRNQKHIQKPGIFRMLAYSKSEVYSEPCQTSLFPANNSFGLWKQSPQVMNKVT